MKAKVEAVLMLALVVTFVLFFLPQRLLVFGSDVFDGNFNVAVEVYVLALEGVDCSGVENLSKMVEGALQACDLSFTNGSIMYNWMVAYWGEYREIKVNLSVSRISNWNQYKQIVESEDNTIIINCHGEVLPVPHGYSEEGWISKIAEAMLERRMTWAHTANYPLKYSWKEDTNTTTELGLTGFRALMSHIGLNVTGVDCLPPGDPKELLLVNQPVKQSLGLSWAFDGVNFVEQGYPLNGSVFKEYVVQSLWGLADEYMTGAVIAYKNLSQGNHGFYVHIGTNATFDSQQQPTNGDWLRGYVATAASIYAVAISNAGEHAIAQAESAIIKAEEEGRTVGLEDARSHLEKAQGYFEKTHFSPLIESVYYSMDAAENAQKPANPLQQYALLLVALATIGVTTTSLAIGFKNKKGTSKAKGEKLKVQS
jgi:hypothetical protein